MSTFAFIQICGNIGDVQLRKSPGGFGKPYLRLNVAVDERVKGEKRTAWYVCIISGRPVETPENLLKVFKIGRKVFVKGTPQLQIYVKGDGSMGASTTVLVDGLPTVLDPKPEDYG